MTNWEAMFGDPSKTAATLWDIDAPCPVYAETGNKCACCQWDYDVVHTCQNIVHWLKSERHEEEAS